MKGLAATVIVRNSLPDTPLVNLGVVRLPARFLMSPQEARTITGNRLEGLLAVVLACIAVAASPFVSTPRHAFHPHQPCLRAPGARPAKPRHHTRLQGRELTIFRATAGALAAVTVLIAWHGFNLASVFLAGGA